MSDETKGSVQVFRIVRAPECQPIKTSDLVCLLFPFRRDSQWMVTEITDDIAAKNEEIETLENTIGLMKLGEGMATKALDELTQDVNARLEALKKEIEEFKKDGDEHA